MRIVIVKLSALGDIIHAMLVLQFIKNKYASSKIDWIVDDNFKDILVNNPDINQIIPLKIKQAKKQKSLKLFFGELKKLQKLDKYDLVIDAQGLLKSSIIAKFIKAKNRVGFDKNSIRESIASIFYHQKIAIDYSENVILRNIYLTTQALNIDINKNDIDNKSKFLFCQDYQFNELSKVKKNIILVLGASFPSKIYPIEKYAQIVKKIDANFIVIWGDAAELQMAQKLQTIAKINICNKLSLDKLKSLIFQSDLVIGGDTGPTHMAWAMNIKAVVLFGATPFWRNAWSDNKNILIDSGNRVSVDKIDKITPLTAEIESDKIIEKIECLLYFRDLD